MSSVMAAGRGEGRLPHPAFLSPTLTQAGLLAGVYAFLGWSPWQGEVKLKEAWPLEFRAGGADPHMVPQKPSEPGDLESTLGLEPHCRSTGLQSAKLTRITRATFFITWASSRLCKEPRLCVFFWRQ